jgi:hypothetical protein
MLCFQRTVLFRVPAHKVVGEFVANNTIRLRKECRQQFITMCVPNDNEPVGVAVCRSRFVVQIMDRVKKAKVEMKCPIAVEGDANTSRIMIDGYCANFQSENTNAQRLQNVRKQLQRSLVFG